jgi:hypothetical protein
MKFLLSIFLTFLILPVLSALSFAQAPSSAIATTTSPDEILKTGRLIYICTGYEDTKAGRIGCESSGFMSQKKLEEELLKRSEFRHWQMVITRNREEAEMLLEITRKKFTTRFTLNIINARDSHIIASFSATSIGGTIEPKLAKGFVDEIKKHRR